MLFPSSSNTAIVTKYGIPLYLALIAAGLAGNHFSFHLFLNVEFIFGSIFAMLALQFFGLARGILAAGLIASYTWFSWNNRDPASAVRRHDIPVIALTGNALKQDRDRCVNAGMDDHLPKPLVLADLLVMLEKWLQSGVKQS